MPQMKILKPEILKQILDSTELKKKIADANFIKPDSVRILLRNYDNTSPNGRITEYNTMFIVQKHLKIKKMDDMFITKEIVK